MTFVLFEYFIKFGDLIKKFHLQLLIKLCTCLISSYGMCDEVYLYVVGELVLRRYDIALLLHLIVIKAIFRIEVLVELDNIL